MQEHTLTELDSGIRVVTERVPSVRSIALGLWVRVGSRDEHDERGRHLALPRAHAVQGHAEELTAEQIAQVFDGFGADVNAATSKETTVLHAHFLDEHLDEAFEVMGDMLLRSTYADLESEREVVLEEIAMYEDEPQDKVHDVLSHAIFGDHPLGRPVIGRGEVISALTTDDVAAYHDTRYLPPQHRRRGRRQPRARRDRAPRGGEACRRPAPATALDPGAPRPPRRRARAVVPREGDRAVPHLPRRPGHPRNDDRRFALSILDAILGGSTLLAPVPGGAREARPRVRGLLVGEPVPGHRPGRHLRRHARGQRREALEVIGTELERLQDEPVGDEELDARPRAREGPARAVDGVDREPHEPARALGADGTPLLSLDETIERLEAVDREQLQELARDFYPPEALSAAAIGRDEELSARRWPVSAELAAA